MKTKITLENEIRFSESMIWNEQKKYYDSKGIDAWGEDVPFYITSNPFIGRQYAQIAIGFIQDWLKKNPGSEESPFYFLELGVGTGQFSFYFLKNLVELQSILELQHIKIRYVMSDITTKSFDFWKSHHCLKPFIESGILQFLEYDLYQSEKMPFEIKNPLVVIANYLFDSLSTDVFTVNDGQLFESLVTLNTNTSNLKNKKIIDWKKVDITYTEKPVHEKYYNNSFDEILLVYAKQLMESHFQFPAASLEALKNLQLHCSNQFLLLTSDKG
ncbi:MAG: SAM-dependent methyltransferase, partial [Gammaproteobacteria bacterium]|nr:SAM-dependent methyltransferase [Gammaproteobacteria bacterium]